MNNKPKTIEEEQREIIENMKTKLKALIKNFDKAEKLLSGPNKAEGYAELNKQEEENGNTEGG